MQANELPYRHGQQRTRDIRAGDVVLSFDPATGAHLARAVTKLYRGKVRAFIALTYLSDDAKKTLVSTTEHPFLTPNDRFVPIAKVIGASERWAA